MKNFLKNLMSRAYMLACVVGWAAALFYIERMRK